MAYALLFSVFVISTCGLVYELTAGALYRFELRLRGSGTLPAFAEKVHTALFVDAGKVWDGGNSFGSNELRVGAGIEARADVTLGYWLKVTPALGFAHGFDRGGQNQIYFTVYIGL